MQQPQQRPKGPRPIGKEIPKALMPYKPNYTNWVIAGLVIVAVVAIFVFFSQLPQSPPVNPTPAVSIAATPEPTKLSTPTPIPTPTPTDEPMPTIVFREISKCGPVSQDIVLENDLESKGTCFVVGAQGITIDCSGHRITGKEEENSSAVYSEFEGTSIKNCNISKFEVGVRLKNADSSSVVESIFSENRGGMLVQTSKGLLIKGNQFFNNPVGGLILNSVDGSEILDNFADGSKKYGIQLVTSDMNTLKGNQIYRNTYGLQISGSRGNLIEGNNVSFNTAGIKITSRSMDNVLKGNQVNGNRGVGLHVLDWSSAVISGNTFNGNEYGINVLDTFNIIDNNIVCENSISDFYCEFAQNATGNACLQRSTVCGFDCERRCP